MILQLKKGFTLIELLVVITIIGVLAAVMVAYMDPSRNKSIDANVKQNLATVRTQAELYFYANRNSYGTNSVARNDTTCDDTTMTDNFIGLDTKTLQALSALKKVNGGVVVCNVAVNGTKYAIAAALRYAIGAYWCIDSTGVARQISSSLGANVTACPLN